MKRSFAAAVLIAALGTVSLLAQEPPKPETPPAPQHGATAPEGSAVPAQVGSAGVAHDASYSGPFDTLEKKVGYAYGRQIGQMLKQQNAETIDIDALVIGLHEAMHGTAPTVSDSVIQEAVRQWQAQARAKAMKAAQEAAAKNKETGLAFLEKNKTAEGVQVTKSGLQYKVVKQGQGPKPGPKDNVSVNYEGTLTDGTVFDSSYRRGHPSEFGVGQVIPGWTEGLQLMETGSTFMLYIPSELAYGMQGPPNIGPNQTLVFKVELLEIKPPRGAPPGLHPINPNGNP
jgi:FKBP-type peptidyl-prolyl cis-trans isomerase